ncbi:MAG: hypothetical protein AAFX99_35280, partial [Myxococcota bacterium]
SPTPEPPLLSAPAAAPSPSPNTPPTPSPPTAAAEPDQQGAALQRALATGPDNSGQVAAALQHWPGLNTAQRQRGQALVEALKQLEQEAIDEALFAALDYRSGATHPGEDAILSHLASRFATLGDDEGAALLWFEVDDERGHQSLAASSHDDEDALRSAYHIRVVVWAEDRLETHPDDTEALERLGHALYNQGSSIDGLTTAEQILALEPQHLRAHALRLDTLLELERLDELHDACRAYVQLSRDIGLGTLPGPALDQLISASLRIRELGTAQRALQLSLAKNASIEHVVDTRLLLEWVNLLLQGRVHDVALRIMGQSPQSHDGHEPLCVIVGRMLIDAGDTTCAAAVLDEAIAEPEATDLIQQLITLDDNVSRGNYLDPAHRRLLEFARHQLDTHPDDPEALRSLALSLYLECAYDEAHMRINALLDLDPTAEDWLLLARLLDDIDADRHIRHQAIRQGLALEPEHEGLAYALDQLDRSPQPQTTTPPKRSSRPPSPSPQPSSPSISVPISTEDNPPQNSPMVVRLVLLIISAMVYLILSRHPIHRVIRGCRSG